MAIAITLRIRTLKKLELVEIISWHKSGWWAARSQCWVVATWGYVKKCSSNKETCEIEFDKREKTRNETKQANDTFNARKTNTIKTDSCICTEETPKIRKSDWWERRSDSKKRSERTEHSKTKYSGFPRTHSAQSFCFPNDSESRPDPSLFGIQYPRCSRESSCVYVVAYCGIGDNVGMWENRPVWFGRMFVGVCGDHGEV